MVALLRKLQGVIAASSLIPEQKDSLLDYLKPAKRKAEKEQPDKELIGKNLQNVSEMMKNLKETTEAGKSTWQTGVEVFQAVGPWLGMAAELLG
ncbi:MAG: hypothetical protein IGS38_07110 [Synechococcales cyanobacterium M58_A2018_015]|nr:hypothetical protein [Synechococcales cyanobacterium M58_A2018_015]